jgi:hypothetical protein
MCSLYAIVRYKYLNRVTRRAVIFHETKRHLAQEEDVHGRSLEKGKCFIFSYSFSHLSDAVDRVTKTSADAIRNFLF